VPDVNCFIILVISYRHFDIHYVLRVSSSAVYREPRFMYYPPIFKQKTIINDCVSNLCTAAEVSLLSKWYVVLYEVYENVE
jgi:hypothetical protein